MVSAVSQNTTDWNLTATGGLDLLAVIVLFMAAGVLSLWTWRSLDPVFSLRKRLLITIVRTLALAMGVGLIVQPTVNIRALSATTGEFAVLIDVSDSMVQGGKNSRLTGLRKLLTHSDLDRAFQSEGRILSWYGFGDSLYPAEKLDDALNPGGKHLKTDIAGAIEKLVAERELPLDGVVVISDGADTEIPLPRRQAYNTSWAQKHGVPINTVLISNQQERKDLAIVDAKVDPIAFSRSETPIVVTLQSTGLPDREVEVFLWQNGSVVRRKTVPLVGGQSQFTFTIFPSSLGHQVSTITVPTAEDDEIPENNSAHVSYEVIRDKYRILQIAGHPSWDQRFLRQTLKSWPKVDLVSFYILRTTFQSENLGSAGMALIPFPTEDLFEGHLEEFDVIIFQGFEPTVVGVDRYLDDIADFVKKGGALVILSGARGLGIERSFSRSFEEILPVKVLDPQTPKSRLVEETPFRLKVSEGGTGHPLMQLSTGSQDNHQIWRSLMRLDGVARIASVATGGYRLAEHPHLQADDGPAPVIAVKETGSGRTLMIGTDSLWRWRFTNPMQGGPVDVYGRFWKQAIAWLTRSPELERLRVHLNPARVPVGEPTEISVELMNQVYKPMPGLHISYEISWYESDGTRQQEIHEGVLDGSGRYKAQWTPRQEGPYQLTVKGDGLTKIKRFLAISSRKELKHLIPNPPLLQAIAENTGAFFESGTLSPQKWVTRLGHSPQILSHRDISIWDHPLYILCLFALLVTEWILRRRIGLS